MGDNFSNAEATAEISPATQFVSYLLCVYALLLLLAGVGR
jgi:hypothetical protein